MKRLFSIRLPWLALSLFAAIAGLAACGSSANNPIAPVAAPTFTPAPTATPAPASTLPAGEATECVYPSTSAQTVALPNAAGTTGTISLAASATSSTTCINVTLQTGADAGLMSNIARRSLAAHRAPDTSPTSAATPMPLLTLSVNNAFNANIVVTGVTLNTPSNLNFPDGTYYALISDQSGVGYVFTAKNGVLTLSSTPAHFVIIPFDTAVLTLYPRGYIPGSSTPSPSPSPTATASYAPTPTPAPTATPEVTLLKTGPFTYDGCTYCASITFLSETVTGNTTNNGTFNVSKDYMQVDPNVGGPAVEYKETFSIIVNALVLDISTGVGPDLATYTDNPSSLTGTLNTNNDSAIFATLDETPMVPYDIAYDNCSSETCRITFFFTNSAVEALFNKQINAYLQTLKNNIPYTTDARKRNVKM